MGDNFKRFSGVGPEITHGYSSVRARSRPFSMVGGLALVCFFIISFCILSAFAAPKSDLEGNGLKGSVQTVVTKLARFLLKESYDVTGKLTESVVDVQDVIAKGREPYPMRTVYAHDATGNTTGSIKYAPDGSIITRVLYSYDSAGNNVSQVSGTADGSFQSATFFIYDGKGNTIAIIYYVGQGYTRKLVYEYDNHGNRITEVHYENGTIKAKTHNAYDTKDRLAEQLVYDPDGALRSKRVLTYDERGNVSEEINSSKEGSVQRRMTHAYESDAIGNWTKETTTEWLNEGGKLTKKNAQVEERKITYN
ncbi:MAG: hypothetical protein ACREIL_05530 [Nitrospiraceae bacterium]